MPIRQLSDGTNYVKAVNYDGRKLKGYVVLMRKIDGVRALRLADGSVVSRNSKPLHNLDHLTFQDAEIYRTDWNTSVSLVRTESHMDVTQDDVYELTDGAVDPRLMLGVVQDPTPEFLQAKMEELVANGDEGLIIREQGRKGLNWWKVVPEKRADVRITGYKEGTGKNAGMLGSFTTAHGSVGTGFTDEMRIAYWAKRDEMVGKIIEVSYRETTDDDKLRFPAFQRERFDKDEESL